MKLILKSIIFKVQEANRLIWLILRAITVFMIFIAEHVK